MCTSFRLKAQDSSVVIGRTMEFPNLMGARITVLPRGYVGASVAPSGTGRTWKADFGVVGVDAFGQPGWLTDGTNEEGDGRLRQSHRRHDELAPSGLAPAEPAQPPHAAAREPRAGDSPEGDDHTLWSTISNLTDRRYATRGYDNPTPQVIDLGSTDFTPGEPRQVPLSTGGFAALTV